MEEGTEVLIKIYRKLKKQVLVEADSKKRYYPATHWLKEILLGRLTEKKIEQFKVKACVHKTTPQKKRERLYICPASLTKVLPGLCKVPSKNTSWIFKQTQVLPTHSPLTIYFCSCSTAHGIFQITASFI